MLFLIYRTRTLVVFILFGIASCSKKSNSTGMPDPTPQPAVPTATFQVKDGQILDSASAVFVVKGVNVNGPGWPWTRATVPDANLIADVWKYNTVRVNCWPQHPPYVNTNNTDLDGLIKAFTVKKVVVILEDHSFTGTYPNATESTAAITWWTALAKKYKSNGFVWFNIMNEPGNGGSAPAAWLGIHDAIIKAIRAEAPDNIIVCDEHAYGQANGYNSDKSSAALTYGETLTSKYRNIAFSLHTYDHWIYGAQRLQDYAAALKAKNLALLIGEYGTAADASISIASDVFKIAIRNNIGRIAWHWNGEDVHELTTTGKGGGFEVNTQSGAKPSNLSFVGNLVWLDNHGQLAASDPALVPSPVLLANSGFEKGSTTEITGWINFGTAQLDNTPVNVKQGLSSVLIPAPTPGGLGQNIYLQPGAAYKITAWGKSYPAGSLASTVGLKATTVYGGVETALATLDFTESTFTEKSATFTTPMQLAGLFLFVYKNDPGAAFWCDNIRIEKL